MSEKANLLIDVGNTSIKTTYYKHDTRSFSETIRHSTPEQLDTLIQQSTHVYLSNVLKDDTSELIAKQCSLHQVPLFIAKTEATAFGLKNAYKKVENMGVDRWLAMLACMHRSQNNTFIVVDIGTAMTVDAVESGNHIGGWIVPGIRLLKESLFKNTQRVFGAAEKTFLTDFGTDTPVCVDNGCSAQILGTLLMAEKIMKNKVNKFEIFLTGGDKNIISSIELENIILCENLVFEGLTLFVD